MMMPMQEGSRPLIMSRYSRSMVMLNRIRRPWESIMRYIRWRRRAKKLLEQDRYIYD